MKKKYHIPKGWQEKRIVDVCPLQRGFDLPAKVINKGKYPVVYSNGVLNYHNTYKVKGPGVITGRSGTVGKVIYVQQNYWPHNTSLWVTDFSGNDPRYIYYFLQILHIERYSCGTGVPTLNRNDLHPLKVPIPPLSEQKKIVAILSTLDEAIETTEKLIEAKRRLKRGLMQQLLTRRRRLKGFKGKWETTEFGNLIDYEQPNRYLTNNIKPYNKSLIPVLTANKSFILGSTDDKDGIYTSVPAIIFDDFTMNIKYVEFPFKIKSSAIKILKAKNKQTNLKYIHEVMKIAKFPKGVEHKRHFISEYQYIPIDVPQFAEQTAIANVAAIVNTEISNLSEVLVLFKRQKKGLMQKLLTGKIRVNV